MHTLKTAPSPRADQRRRRRKPFLFVLGSVLLASLGLTWSATRLPAAETSAAPAAPLSPKVTIAPVEQKVVTEYAEFTGHVDATETVELRARVSGHIDAVRFQAGQIVKPGDVLFEIDPRWYKAQLDLAQARADLATREAARASDLLAAEAISSEEAESRRARDAEARAALEIARLDYEHTQVRAPIAGRIGRALVTAGNLVSGNPGGATLLATIVSTGPAYVYADIDEPTVLRFNRLVRQKHVATLDGRVPVELQLADETGYPRRGYIESSDNHLNPGTGTLLLRMIFPNDDSALVPGLFARVRIPVGAPQPTLLVSERAVGTDQNQKFVLTVDDTHTAVYRSVRLGGMVDGKRIVRDGLAVGDEVIVNGLQRVRPGMTVDPEIAVAEVSSPRPTTVAVR